jgi:serine/threonine-protein kinase
MALKIGQLFGDYRIDAKLGAGGMGDVYKVTNRLTDVSDAAKVLKPELTSDAERERFLREIRTLARLKHPNIVDLRTALTDGEQVMMVIEYVDGESLGKAHDKLQEPEAILKIAKQLLGAFDYAHRQGVIHRDIKPENIMITKDGQVKILDFGIAKIVQEQGITPVGFILGSPRYMSPEQIKEEPLDHRTDIYSLGIVLYEVVTGKAPFDGAIFTMMYKHVHVPPAAPSDHVPIPSWLNEVILRAIAKKPEDRFSSAREMLEALELGASEMKSGAAVDGGVITEPNTSRADSSGSGIGLDVQPSNSPSLVKALSPRPWWRSKLLLACAGVVVLLAFFPVFIRWYRHVDSGTASQPTTQGETVSPLAARYADLTTRTDAVRKNTPACQGRSKNRPLGRRESRPLPRKLGFCIEGFAGAAGA